MTKIAILGGGLAGKLAALYFEQHFPDATITLVDPEAPHKPIVGESTVEVTTHFLNALGLGGYLEEQHLHKYGLTWYFRLPENRDDPNAPEYVRHESPGVKRALAFNLNRHTFDEELNRRISTRVIRVKGKATAVTFAGGAPALDAMADAKMMADKSAMTGRKRLGHRFLEQPLPPGMRCGPTPGPQVVTIESRDGETRQIEADHVIDATGRTRLLTRQLGLERKPPYQRSTYWFRLAGFDRRILMETPVAKEKQNSFDSYYVTHHFYGKGYWIWIIPMKSETGEDMVSFGIVYRPDISGEKAMNMERLLAILDRDHPRLAALVRSGHKVDEARYFNYMYEAEQYYDREGRWFMLGDSGFTFDPSNSAGIAYVANQIPQIASMIKKAEAGELSERYVEALEDHLKAQLALQDIWSNWYDVMNDPVKMPWILVVSVMGYFSVVLPDYITGSFLNGGLAKQFAGLFQRWEDQTKMRPVYPFPEIMDRLADTTDPAEIIRRTPSLHHTALPSNYYSPGGINRGKLVGRYQYRTAWLRTRALHLLKWWKDPALYGLAARQYGMSALNLLLAAVLTVRPQIWDRARSRQPDMTSAFDPMPDFLFPRHPTMIPTQGGKVQDAAPAKPAEAMPVPAE